MDLDIHLDGSWRPCARVELLDPRCASLEDGVVMRYDADYALANLHRRDVRAVSVHWPVTLAVRKLDGWPSFLRELLPRGAARARLERGGALDEADWGTLARSAVNPGGNVRVRPSEPRALGTHPGFEFAEILAQGDRFIDYAAEAGAQLLGATDVPGDWPKFWAVETTDGRWLPDDGRLGGRARRYALLKFPLSAAGPVDMLRLEAAYQRVAQRLGLFVAPELPEFIEGVLVIQRFDRRCGSDGEIRLGVESLGAVAGCFGERSLSHTEALLALRRCVTDFERDLLEYLQRDILNLALGNRDNEPGNTAILKELEGSMRLAPLYDFGPSFLDARPVVRTVRWEEEGGAPMDWGDILGRLERRFAAVKLDLGDLTRLVERLRAFAQELAAVPALMAECGVEDSVIGQRRRPIDTLRRALGELRLR
jgi:serine/threonine-protein kinase HipA